MELDMKLAMFVFSCGMVPAAFGGISLQEIVQEREVSVPLVAGEAFFNFDQFDDLGGTRTLEEVELSFDVVMNADVTAENEAPTAAEFFELLFDGDVEVLLDGFNISNMSSDAFGATLAESDGTEGAGPDFVDYGTLTLGLSTSDSRTTNLSEYRGNGNVDGILTSVGEFNFSGTTGATITVEEFELLGSVSLTYRYVPAPGAAALLGLSGLATLRRRR
jgi:uncharacterized protein (TIGR03382 family)